MELSCHDVYCDYLGKVFLRQRLDYESLSSKTLSFQVEAFTGGPPKKTALTTVYVQVQDVNDHSPKFVQDVRVVSSVSSLSPGPTWPNNCL